MDHTMDPRHAILFEPVRIGPVTAPNRFYQTPHATGFGWQRPQSGAALRGIKAEGGWGVVCTEYCSIHPTSDDSPYAFLTLWEDDDIAPLAATADAIHAHGSLAGIELWHGGSHASNRMTRLPGIGPQVQPAMYHLPTTARAMDKADIRAFRGWQRDAARRAPTVAVDLGRAAEPVSEELGRMGIACWAGDFYAVRPLTAMGVDLGKGVLRLSGAHYTGADDVARLIAALDRVL